MVIQNISAPIISYIIGSISFGYIVAKVAKGIDIRQVGSGNPGATNVGRVAGRKYGILVFFLDMLKGFLPLFFYSRLFVGQGQSFVLILCGVAVICGHIFPVFLGFRGGKAAATGCGVFLCLAPVPLLISIGVWGITVAVTRYVSLGTILSSMALVIALIVVGNDPFGQGFYLTIFSLLISILIIVRHKTNIKRLLNGTENKIGVCKRE